jgi:hypothetical protein
VQTYSAPQMDFPDRRSVEHTVSTPASLRAIDVKEQKIALIQ